MDTERKDRRGAQRRRVLEERSSSTTIAIQLFPAQYAISPNPERGFAWRAPSPRPIISFFSSSRDSMRRTAPMVKDALSPVDMTMTFQDYEQTARKAFRVNPALCFYDDGNAPNALAMPDVLFADGPDGTVLIGDKLTQYEWTRDRQINLFPFKFTIGGAWQSLEIVVAHEFAHILQFKRGLAPTGPWEMEPHADFMAGWLIGLKMEEMIKFYGTEIGSFGIEEGTKSMFERGDTY